MALRRLALLTLVLSSITLIFGMSGCRAIGIREYEYDERVDLALDGSAVVDVNASIAALVYLRGATLDVDPEARLDRQAVRRLYESGGNTVRQLSSFRRHGRRFVHVQLEVGDIRRLSESGPFSWSRYQLDHDDQAFRFVQDVGLPSGPPPSGPPLAPPGNVGSRAPLDNVGWRGDELIAFRIHLPSRIQSNNSPTRIERGNILVWEQALQQRLAGAPLRMEASMDTQSILSRTLWLFGATFAATLCVLALLIWWIRRRGRTVVPA